MDTTGGVRITAAAGTYLTLLLFAKLFRPGKSKHCLHSNSPYHAFAHCKGFATAAPRRARVLISVPFSGLRLSTPVRIVGLVGRYPANSLIRRSPILRRNNCIPLLVLQIQQFQFGFVTADEPQFPGIAASLGQVDYVLLSRTPGTTPVPKTCMAKSEFDSSIRQQDQLEFSFFFSGKKPGKNVLRFFASLPILPKAKWAHFCFRKNWVFPKRLVPIVLLTNWNVFVP